jgi:four helix bundle protein
MLKDFRAFQLAKSYYKGCKSLKLPSHLKDQLMRASSSIALNLAESSGKLTQKDKIKYFSIAFGSLRESQAILEIEEIENPKLIEISDQLGGMLYKLCKISDRESANLKTEYTTESPINEPQSSIVHLKTERIAECEI